MDYSIDDVTSMDIPVDLVDRVRSILSGEPQKPDNAEQVSTRVDGRTKAFKETARRIETRRTRNTTVEEESDVNELQYQDSPSYRGGSSIVRGGLAMTDDRLGKLRIMMRNIAKFEGIDVLADEICDALDRSDGMELAQAIIKKKRSY